MDTDDLSDMAYKCIIYAYETAETLKIELGVECGNHANEDNYLKSIQSYVHSIKGDPYEYLDGWGLIDETDKNHFLTSINILLKHIESTLELPINKR